MTAPHAPQASFAASPATAHVPGVEHAGGEAHASHDRLYWIVFLALCGLTALSVVADVVHLADRRVLIAIVMSVATAKALCVMLYFMHLQFERAWKYLLLPPTIILAASLPLALSPDISLHYYTVDTPQSRARLESRGEQGASAHAPAEGQPATPPAH